MIEIQDKREDDWSDSAQGKGIQDVSVSSKNSFNSNNFYEDTS